MIPKKEYEEYAYKKCSAKADQLALKHEGEETWDKYYSTSTTYFTPVVIHLPDSKVSVSWLGRGMALASSHFWVYLCLLVFGSGVVSMDAVVQ